MNELMRVGPELGGVPSARCNAKRPASRSMFGRTGSRPLALIPNGSIAQCPNQAV